MNNGKEEFSNFLRKEEKNIINEPQIDWNARKAEWFQNINLLYSDVQKWLKDFIDEGKIKIEFNDLDLYEEKIGKYTVQELNIFIGSHVAKLTPIGTLLLGSIGRIDLSGRTEIVKFILADRNSSKPNISIRIISSIEEEKYQEDLKKISGKKIDWVWKISSNPPSIKYTELNENSFFESLIKVINE
jgi:hypothetical protein